MTAAANPNQQSQIWSHKMKLTSNMLGQFPSHLGFQQQEEAAHKQSEKHSQTAVN